MTCALCYFMITCVTTPVRLLEVEMKGVLL
jgi:hypothetical protein